MTAADAATSTSPLVFLLLEVKAIDGPGDAFRSSPGGLYPVDWVVDSIGGGSLTSANRAST